MGPTLPLVSNFCFQHCRSSECWHSKQKKNKSLTSLSHYSTRIGTNASVLRKKNSQSHTDASIAVIRTDTETPFPIHRLE